MNNLTRIAALAALTVLATVAHAYQFAVLSDGTFDANTRVASEVVVGQVNTPAALQVLSMFFSGNTLTGNGEYVSANGNLDFTFTYPNVNFVNDGQYVAATWTYSNTSTGAYANMTGGGTFGFGINAFNGDSNSWHSNTALVGNLTNAVPEPASLAILSIGAVATIRRRRVR